jgi:hypothetical protein
MVFTAGLAGMPTGRAEAQHGLTQDQRYVRQLFRDMLGRPGSVAEWQPWVNLLSSSGRDVSGLIQRSMEARAGWIQDTYEDFLHRSADQAGINGFLSFLGQGGTQEQILVILTTSDEYFQGRGGNSGNGFIRALYHDLLHRSPSSAEIKSWSTLLAQPNGRSQAAAAILNSGEAHSAFIVRAYRAYLHRAPTARELDDLVQSMNNGLGREGLVRLLIGSDEYYNRPH